MTLYQPTFSPEHARRYADDLAERAAQLVREVADAEIDVTSPDKSIRVTVTIPGKITGLELDRSMGRHGDMKTLERAILATIQQAQQVSEKLGMDLVSRHLPNLPAFENLISPEVRGKSQ